MISECRNHTHSPEISHTIIVGLSSTNLCAATSPRFCKQSSRVECASARDAAPGPTAAPLPPDGSLVWGAAGDWAHHQGSCHRRRSGSALCGGVIGKRSLRGGWLYACRAVPRQGCLPQGRLAHAEEHGLGVELILCGSGASEVIEPRICLAKSYEGECVVLVVLEPPAQHWWRVFNGEGLTGRATEGSLLWRFRRWEAAQPDRVVGGK